MSEPKVSEGVNDALTELYNKAYRLGQERMRERCGNICAGKSAVLEREYDSTKDGLLISMASAADSCLRAIRALPVEE